MGHRQCNPTMPSPRLSLLFLPTVLLSISSSPLQSQPLPLPLHSTTLLQPIILTHPSPLSSDSACVRKRRFWDPCPNYYDCLHAIFQLPDLDGGGSFHNGPPNDPFRLPVAKTHGTCRVRVELQHQGSSRQASSWPVLVHMALTLATICLDTPLRAPENTGGWMVLGRQERLVIFVEHSRLENGAFAGEVGVGVGGEVGGEWERGGGNMTVL